MGDTLKKVQAGDPLKIPAEAFTTFIDAARDFQARQRHVGQAATPQFRQAGVVLVRNDSGADRDRFDVLGLNTPIITHSDNADEFKSRPALTGVTPTADHVGQFAILLEPVATGGIVRACLAGVTIARVYVHHDDHEYADVKASDASQLGSADEGAATILWKESGTGTKWAVINIGGGAELCLWGKATANWVNDSTTTGNGCYVNVNPCKRDGTSVVTAVTHKVWLPRNGRREDPNVRQDDVIAYQREPGGDYANPSGCLDGKCGETVRIHLDPANIPAGWELFGQKQFLVGYDGDEYPTVGATGGFKLHGGDGDGAANNHDDHDPRVVGGTGDYGYAEGDIKGWLDGSWDHTETDNRPPYQVVVVWIKRTS